MSEEKVPALEIEETEVAPIELPDDANLRRSDKGQQSFGEDPSKVKEEETTETSPDSGKFPRATARRKKREEAKKLKEQQGQLAKYIQAMKRPVRHGDMQGIFQHIQVNMIQPHIDRLDALVDKLQLLPDFLGNCLNDEGKFDIEPSLETFDEFVDNYMKKLEEEEAAEKARIEEEEKEKAKTAAIEEATKALEDGKDCSCAPSGEGCNVCAPDPKDTPQTEETQKE